MGLLTSTENKCFQRWKHRVHDKQTSTEKHPMACTRKSLRLDRATWGGTPSCIQGGEPCYTQGVELCRLLKSCSSWSWVLSHARQTRPVSYRLNSVTLTHSFTHGTGAINRAARQCTCPPRQKPPDTKPPDTIMVVCAAPRFCMFEKEIGQNPGIFTVCSDQGMKIPGVCLCIVVFCIVVYIFVSQVYILYYRYRW